MRLSTRVCVGVGIMVVKNGLLLGGWRKHSSLAHNLWSFPGGHLELGESFEDCIRHELREECGKEMQVRLRPRSELSPEWFVTNDIMPEFDAHYVTLFFLTDWLSGDPVNAEPDKCAGWEWLSLNETLNRSTNHKYPNWIPFPQLMEHRHAMGLV